MSWQKTIIWVLIYSIGMAFLESAVVVYLREIYYPFGFEFPLAPIDKHIALAELGREVGTLLMLLSIGFLAGRSKLQRIAYFILSFAVWDIFYYVFLKLILAWPESLFTWDILFLIPTLWVGPVITPLFTSCLMIVLALYIIRREGRGFQIKMTFSSWVLLILGSLVLFISFIWDYSSYILSHHSISELWSWSAKDAVFETSNRYMPHAFNWLLFSLSQLLILGGIVQIVRQSWAVETEK